MVSPPDTVRELEEILRGSGVTITPMDTPREDIQELQTADGRFRVEPARVLNRSENMVTLYRTDTAEAVPTDVNEAVKRLKKRFPDTEGMRRTHPELAGRHAFTLGKWNERENRYGPPFQEIVGVLVCPLHRDSPDFEYTRSLGIATVCPRTRLPNMVELTKHMESRHTGDQLLIRQDKADKEKAADRGHMDRLIELLLQQRGIDTSKVPEMAKTLPARKDAGVGVAAPKISMDVDQTYSTRACEIEGCSVVLEAKTPFGLRGRQRGHMKKDHGIKTNNKGERV